MGLPFNETAEQPRLDAHGSKPLKGKGRQMIYRDVANIRKDVLAVLRRQGELTQSDLLNYCGLNNTKHKAVLLDLLEKQMVSINSKQRGSMTITRYNVTAKGARFLTEVMEPYEHMFPRQDSKIRPASNALGGHSVAQ